MTNVTLSLDDVLARRARVEAAREGKSLSRFVSELVERRIGGGRSSTEALDAFLSGPLLPLSQDGKLPSRAELYDDALLHRHQHPDLQPGSK